MIYAEKLIEEHEYIFISSLVFLNRSILGPSYSIPCVYLICDIQMTFQCHSVCGGGDLTHISKPWKLILLFGLLI